MSLLEVVRRHGLWAALSFSLALWAWHERRERHLAQGRAEVAEGLAANTQALHQALETARTTAASQHAALEQARAHIAETTREDELSAKAEAAQAQTLEEAITDELHRTQRVTQAAQRSWERWRQRAH